MLAGTTDEKIKRVSIWFYVIAAFQFVSAYFAWSMGTVNAALAQGAMALAVVDVVIGMLFIVFGYFAARKQPWAFVAGLIVYALRAMLQLFSLFNPIALVIRCYLLFRMYQGLQACLDAKRAQMLTSAQASPRRLEIPHTPVASAAVAWTPIRPTQPPPES